MGTDSRRAILEAYAERLHRHRDRIEDDIAAARVRTVWRAHELDARAALSAADVDALEAVGVLGDHTGDSEDAALIARRTRQADALDALARFTEHRIRGLREHQPEETA